jgi:putative membrane protein
MMWGYPTAWWGVLLMTLGMLLWYGILAVAIWALVRWLVRAGSTSGPSAGGPSALEILRQRNARGEIDAVTYEKMRARLEGTSPSAPYARGPVSMPR